MGPARPEGSSIRGKARPRATLQLGNRQNVPARFDWISQGARKTRPKPCDPQGRADRTLPPREGRTASFTGSLYPITLPPGCRPATTSPNPQPTAQSDAPPHSAPGRAYAIEAAGKRRRASATVRKSQNVRIAYETGLEFRILRRPRERNHIPDVGHPGHEEHQTLESQPEAAVRRAPETTSIQIPLHRLGRHPHLLHPGH